MPNPERLGKISQPVKNIAARLGGRIFLAASLLTPGLILDGLSKQAQAAAQCAREDFIGGATVWGDSLRVAIGVIPRNNESTQFQWKLIPFNNDGPGINTYRGDKENFIADKPVSEGFEGPKMTADGPQGSTIILPKMIYTGWWRNSKEPTPLNPDSDIGWCPWRSLIITTHGHETTSLGIRPVKLGGVVYSEGAALRIATRNPVLQWDDTDPAIFYYEIQLSKDHKFGKEGAVAAVFHNLVHGGLKPPYRSWQVPREFPLEAGQTYHFRIRPRIQGDGVPVEWSRAWQFEVAANATLTAEEIEATP